MGNNNTSLENVEYFTKHRHRHHRRPFIIRPRRRCPRCRPCRCQACPNCYRMCDELYDQLVECRANKLK